MLLSGVGTLHRHDFKVLKHSCTVRRVLVAQKCAGCIQREGVAASRAGMSGCSCCGSLYEAALRLPHIL